MGLSPTWAKADDLKVGHVLDGRLTTYRGSTPLGTRSAVQDIGTVKEKAYPAAR